MSLFSDSGVGLVLSMVRYSPDIKQVYNCKANDVGSCIMNGRIVYVLVSKRLSTNCLYDKAAERAVLTARLTGIKVLQLQSPCIEYIFNTVK